MNPNHIIALILFLLGLNSISCGNKSNLIGELEKENNIGYQWTNPIRTKVYHINQSESELHIQIPSELILFQRGDKTESLTANINIQGFIQTINYESPIDTINFDIQGMALNDDFYIYHKKNIKLTDGNNYKLSLLIHDLNRNQKTLTTLFINKTILFSEENLIVTDKKTGLPNFNNFLHPDKEYIIESTRINLTDTKTLFKKTEPQLPPPPYSKSQVDLPSLEQYEDLKSTKLKSEISLIKPLPVGDMLLINELEEGITFLIRPNYYPEVSRVSELIEPLRYICARKEFERIKSNSNVKSGLDKFWLDCGDSKERAKELINTYYQRVETANQHFSSFADGWRTDRGLIYIVFGMPSSIKTQKEDEIWSYGNNDIDKVEFHFKNKDNSFSTNHYELQRESIYKSEWARHVGAWRNGRIF